MTLDTLVSEIKRKRSFLCVGLDTDLAKIPEHLLIEDDPVFAFNKAIIDATHPYCVAYKPNIAFYEAQGVNGWRSLEKTIRYLNHYHAEIFTIADAKRGDIGNTADQYAKAFFDDLDFDSLTVAPYMGRDSVEPFLAYEGKFAILLALTSNPGAFDFQLSEKADEQLFENVLKISSEYAHAERLMYVVGATKAEYIRSIRAIVPNSFLLIPGVGVQGGDLKTVCETAMTDQVGILINSSRGIIYGSRDTDYAEVAAARAQALQEEMAQYLAD
ncbi:MAG: orotidine-5'-phosphate decarboxylase [Eudoraea sp.]|nr:orotidine-5'-phosphate decarboxylase [Eudoraea sp.]